MHKKVEINISIGINKNKNIDFYIDKLEVYCSNPINLPSVSLTINTIHLPIYITP